MSVAQTYSPTFDPMQQQLNRDQRDREFNPDGPLFDSYAPRSPPPQSHMYPPAVQQPPAHTAPADKLMFFDRAKRALESKEMYEEFLKLLSLFSKDIIDIQTLVERAKVFLGEETLLAEFKDLVGWDEKMENPLDYGPPGSIRMQAPDACAPQPVDDGEGPSYRRLPESVRCPPFVLLHSTFRS